MDSFRYALSHLSDQALFLSLQDALERRKQEKSQELADLCKALRGELGDRLPELRQAGITRESFERSKADLVESMKAYNAQLLDSYNLEGADECEALLSIVEGLESRKRPEWTNKDG
jgi:hypothetical protein